MREVNEYDVALGLMRRQQKSVRLLPKELLCAGAYGSPDVRAELNKLKAKVGAKLRSPTDSMQWHKGEFEIDLSANEGEGSVTCSARITMDFRMARDGKYRLVQHFRFSKEMCERCELRERCLDCPAGRAERPVPRARPRQASTATLLGRNDAGDPRGPKDACAEVSLAGTVTFQSQSGA